MYLHALQKGEEKDRDSNPILPAINEWHVLAEMCSTRQRAAPLHHSLLLLQCTKISFVPCLLSCVLAFCVCFQSLSALEVFVSLFSFQGAHHNAEEGLVGS